MATGKSSGGWWPKWRSRRSHEYVAIPLKKSSRQLRCRRDAPSGTFAFSSDDDEDDEVFELSRLLPRVHGVVASQKKNAGKRIPHSLHDFIERSIEDGDTLQTIALRYGCKVSELKRANNLISDQEFFGLVRIRVPVRAYGVHFEKPSGDVSVPIDALVKKVSISEHINGVERHLHSEGNRFLLAMDADLERIRQSLNTRIETLEEVAKTLRHKRFHPLEQERDSTTAKQSTRWTRSLVALVALLVAIPFVLLLLFKYLH